MRIIAGTARGRRLASPSRTSAIRPTTDRVREALMSILCARMDLDGAAVLDLFAGTGALGCEALSRGARALVAVDRGAEAVALIRDNLRRVDAQDRAEVLRAPWDSALARLRRRDPAPRFDLVFLDPPYDALLVRPVLSALDASGLLAPRAWVVAEHGPREGDPDDLPALRLVTSRAWGDVRMGLWQRAPTSDDSADPPDLAPLEPQP